MRIAADKIHKLSACGLLAFILIFVAVRAVYVLARRQKSIARRSIARRQKSSGRRNLNSDPDYSTENIH